MRPRAVASLSKTCQACVVVKVTSPGSVSGWAKVMILLRSIDLMLGHFSIYDYRSVRTGHPVRNVGISIISRRYNGYLIRCCVSQEYRSCGGDHVVSYVDILDPGTEF